MYCKDWQGPLRRWPYYDEESKNLQNVHNITHFYMVPLPKKGPTSAWKNQGIPFQIDVFLPLLSSVNSLSWCSFIYTGNKRLLILLQSLKHIISTCPMKKINEYKHNRTLTIQSSVIQQSVTEHEAGKQYFNCKLFQTMNFYDFTVHVWLFYS